MIPFLRELFDHQAWADSALMKAVRAHAAAAEDEELRKVLNHIVLVQRAFPAILFGSPFDLEKEKQPAASFEALEQRFREAQALWSGRLERLEESDLARVVDVPWLPGMRISVQQGVTQVAMHSHGHRAQCAARLRSLGAIRPSSITFYG